MQKRIWMTGVMLLILTLTTGSVFAAESAHTKEEVVRAYMEQVVPENAEEVSSAVQVTVKEAGKETVDAVSAVVILQSYIDKNKK